MGAPWRLVFVLIALFRLSPSLPQGGDEDFWLTHKYCLETCASCIIQGVQTQGVQKRILPFPLPNLASGELSQAARLT